MSKTQTQVVFEHLRKRGITQAEAVSKYGIFGLSKLISVLRQHGHQIDKQWVIRQVGGADRRMMRYTLRKEAQ